MLGRSILFSALLLVAGCAGAAAADSGPLIDGVEAPQRVARNADGNYHVESRIKFHDPNGDEVIEARIAWNARDLGRAGILTVALPSSDRKASGGAQILLPFAGDLEGVIELRIVLVDEEGREGEAITRRVVLEG